MENWLEIAVGLYLLVMIVYGYCRGVIRMIVSVAALAATFVIVRMAMPSVTLFIKNETPVCQWVAGELEKKLIPHEAQAQFGDSREIIESLNLPEELQELLGERGDGGGIFDIEVFISHIADYLAEMIINSVGFVVLFLAVYIIMGLVIRSLDLIAKLPVISGVNRMAGALLGGAEGLFFLYLALLLVTAFSSKPWAAGIIAQIESSKWLPYLYHYNLVSKIVLGLIRGIK